jgi:hypothetical protein
MDAQGRYSDSLAVQETVSAQIPAEVGDEESDAGPLTDVITAPLAEKVAMRAHAVKSTMALLIAPALHAIATGNMLPAFVMLPDGSLRELATICVDSAEFVVSKLKDRGTHQAFGVVTNAQDFMHILRLYVEREIDQRRAANAAPPTDRAVAAAR